MRTSLLPGLSTRRSATSRAASPTSALFEVGPRRSWRAGDRQGSCPRRAAVRPRRSWSGRAPAGSSRASRSTSSTPRASRTSCCARSASRRPCFRARAERPCCTRAAGADDLASAGARRVGRLLSASSTRGSRARSASTRAPLYLELDARRRRGRRRPIAQRPSAALPGGRRATLVLLDAGVTGGESAPLLRSAARAAAARAGRARGLPRRASAGRARRACSGRSPTAPPIAR